MNVKTMLGIVINILTIVAEKTKSTADDQILALLKAINASDAFVAFLQSLFDKFGGSVTAPIPGTALPMIDAGNPELSAAFNASPALKEWAMQQRPESIPEGAEGIGIGSVLMIVKWLPTILAILKQFKAQQPTT